MNVRCAGTALPIRCPGAEWAVINLAKEGAARAASALAEAVDAAVQGTSRAGAMHAGGALARRGDAIGRGRPAANAPAVVKRDVAAATVAMSENNALSTPRGQTTRGSGNIPRPEAGNAACATPGARHGSYLCPASQNA